MKAYHFRVGQRVELETNDLQEAKNASMEAASRGELRANVVERMKSGRRSVACRLVFPVKGSSWSLESSLKASAVDVDSSEWERAHQGERKGQGSWAFCKVHPRRSDYLKHCLWFNGTYADAKRAAKAEAAALGVEVLYVCS
jgi:hypothetical protein